MENEDKIVERCIYAYLLMEHFYAIDQAFTKCRMVNGKEHFKELFPNWTSLAEEFRMTIWSLLSTAEPELAMMWDRVCYVEYYNSKEKNNENNQDNQNNENNGDNK